MNTTSSQQQKFMDKQIMDLSNSQTSETNNNNNSSDFMNRRPDDNNKKDDMVPNYDFMPLRPSSVAVGSSSSSPPPPSRPSILEDSAPIRTWNSFDGSKINNASSSLRNYDSLEVDEPSKFTLGKNQNQNQRSSNATLDVSLVSEIDRTMKKYVDDLMHAMDGMSARLSQLETRARSIENSVDDLKVSFENNHGSADGKMRQLENILREVQTGVHAIRDKQEAVEAELQSAKHQIPKTEQRAESQNITHTNPAQTVPSPQLQFPTVSVPPPPNPHTQQQQNLQPQVQLPNQFPQNQVPSVPRQESYYPPPSQTPENPSQQYQVQPPQQQPPPPSPQHQYQLPQQQQYSQPPPPSQPHPSFAPVNTSPPPPLGHHPEETQYVVPQTYPPSIRPPPSNPPTGIHPPPPQQYYAPTSNVYEPPPNRPGPGYSGPFGPSSGHSEPYPYSSSPSQYGSGSPMKSQQLASPSMGQGGGGSGYPQLPTARILPQAIPTATGIGGGSGSGGSGNKVPIDDVIDRVTNMGFPREQVRATVRRLTENGQAVDLNIVLDKLMNDGGDGQAPRGWFGRQ